MEKNFVYKKVQGIRKRHHYFWTFIFYLNMILVSGSRQTWPRAAISICDFSFPLSPMISRSDRGKSLFLRPQVTFRHVGSPVCGVTLIKVTGGNIAEKQNKVRKERQNESVAREKNTHTQKKQLEILTLVYARLTRPPRRHVPAVQVSRDADAEDKTGGQVGDNCAAAV